MYPFDIPRADFKTKQQIFQSIEKRIYQIEKKVSRIQKYVKKHVSVMDTNDVFKAQQLVNHMDIEMNLLKNLFDFYVTENELIYRSYLFGTSELRF